MKYTHTGKITYGKSKLTVLLRETKTLWVTMGGVQFKKHEGIRYSRSLKRPNYRLDLDSIHKTNTPQPCYPRKG